jgi:ABC-type nitrate/sulfonate/bicarbonate transport system permease component
MTETVDLDDRSTAKRSGGFLHALGAAGRRLANTRLLGVVAIILPLLLVWEFVAAVVFQLPTFPRATTIGQTWVTSMLSGEILSNLVPTLRTIAIGYAIALAIALPLGVAMGSSKVMYNLWEPLVELLRPVPASALVPLLIIFLGFGEGMNVSLIAIAAFFPILLNTMAGIRSVDPILIQTARTLGVSRQGTIWKIRVPAAWPQAFTGMRISLAVALVLAVIAEMLAGNSGIGYFIIQSQRAFAIPKMYAGILTIGLIGYVINQLFLMVERRALRWHYGFTQVQL